MGKLEGLKNLSSSKDSNTAGSRSNEASGNYLYDHNRNSNIDLKNSKLSSTLVNTPYIGGRSPAWLGHQPPTLTTRVQIPATAPTNYQMGFDLIRGLLQLS